MRNSHLYVGLPGCPDPSRHGFHVSTQLADPVDTPIVVAVPWPRYELAFGTRAILVPLTTPHNLCVRIGTWCPAFCDIPKSEVIEDIYRYHPRFHDIDVVRPRLVEGGGSATSVEESREMDSEQQEQPSLVTMQARATEAKDEICTSGGVFSNVGSNNRLLS